jgi:hypothetical protein
LTSCAGASAIRFATCRPLASCASGSTPSPSRAASTWSWFIVCCATCRPQVDGARRDILKPLTHPGETDIVGLYTSFPWPTICAEVAKLKVELPDEAGRAAAQITWLSTNNPAALRREPIALLAALG